VVQLSEGITPRAYARGVIPNSGINLMIWSHLSRDTERCGGNGCTARQNSDEIEKGLGRAQGGSDGGTSSRVFGSFLSWMQEKNEPVFVVATANDVSNLPPEMLRKGRFDEMFFSDLPTPEERLAILTIHLSKYKRDPEKYNLQSVANATEDFSGAELEQIIIDGLYTGFSFSREPEIEDFFISANSTVPLARTMENEVEELRKWAVSRARPAGSRVRVKNSGNKTRSLAM
jgi:hypothetical protein